MVNPQQPRGSKSSKKPQMSPERYAYLKAEAKAPYRLLRRFIYVAFGASGFVGALVFFVQVLTLQNLSTTVPNLALQLGVLSLMVWLFKVDKA